MLAHIFFIITIIFGVLNTIFCSLLICFLAIFKVLLPGHFLKQKIAWLANGVMWLWATLNHNFVLKLFNNIEWDIQGGEALSKDGWYLMISNHLSWADTVVLCSLFKDKIPMPKFFLKQQLLYVPFLGVACWVLDMPFMRRYSREFLIRHPELKGKDLETTKRSCEKFRHIPTTVVNYVEGTRYTAAKQSKTRGDYQHLLPPKSGGIAYTLAAMGEQFQGVIDVTLAYPQNREKPFKEMFSGNMKKIVVRINVLPVDEKITGDYFNDKAYKRQFQLWLSELWKEKDKQLAEIYKASAE